MINAGLKVKSFDGGQAYDTDAKVWNGIKLEMVYPVGQNVNDNKPVAGDMVVEQTGRVWEIKGTPVLDSGTTFVCTLEIKSEAATGSVQPDLGNTSQGAIVTPKVVGGPIVPYWNATFVSDAVSRAAASFSAEFATAAPITNVGGIDVTDIVTKNSSGDVLIPGNLSITGDIIDVV